MAGKARERGHFIIFVSDLSGSTEKKIEDKNKGIDDVNDYHNRVLDVLQWKFSEDKELRDIYFNVSQTENFIKDNFILKLNKLNFYNLI